MKGYRISILRHGLTKASEDGRYIGVTDYPLSDRGYDELTAMYEKYSYPRVQKVYSSPLSRCEQSAKILFPDTYVAKLGNLRELDFGDFEDKTAEELIGKPEYTSWLKGGLDNNPPNGENVREMMMRCFCALDEIIKDMMSEGFTHCGVVTHSGIIMNMLACFGLPKFKAADLACKPGEGFEILASAQMWQMSSTFEILGRIPDVRGTGTNDDAGFGEDYYYDDEDE